MKPLIFSVAAWAVSVLAASSLSAATSLYRLSLRGDPATSMVIGWRQTGATDVKVYYGTTDHGTSFASYPNNVAPHRQVMVKEMDTRFARLSNLSPNTNYYFVIQDSDGVSPRFWFRTASNTHTAFTFITGGDSRTNRTPRKQANKLVAKLRPQFVAFGGDYTDGDSSTQWLEWLTDWQLTISADGRMYPIVATRGNHDENATVEGMFDVPNVNVYYALTFGGSMLRLYTLNTEIAAGGTQKAWLESDLAAQAVLWKVAQYHKPMFPHSTYKGDNVSIYDAWASAFYNYKVDLAVECDSHVVKRTWPLRPSTEPGSHLGYIRDDADGTVFIGEGCWGAPLRNNDDNKIWTRAGGKFNQVDWVHVHPDRMEIRTLQYANVDTVGSVSDSDPFAIPANLSIWNPAGGSVVTIAKGENLAIGGTISAVSSQGAGTAASNVIDGVDFNDSDRWSAASSGYPQFVEVDLGANLAIGGITVSAMQNRAYKFRVEARTESGAYTTVVDRTANTLAAPVTSMFTPVSARYVKLTVTGAHNYSGGMVSILEFKIYAVLGLEGELPLTIGPEADAFVRDGAFASQNDGTGDSLWVKTDSVDYTRWSYLRFDLSAMEGPTFSAVLHLPVIAAGSSAGSNNLRMLLVEDDNWIESGTGGITWSNRPAGSTVLGNYTVTAGGVAQIDLTDSVNAQRSTDGTLSVLILSTTAGSNNQVAFGSREHTAPSLRPRLVIAP